MKKNTVTKIVGVVSTEIESLLQLPSAQDHNIYIGITNINHMKSSHPADYAKYSHEISNILSFPDYIGLNHKDGSIEYVKEYIVDDEFVKRLLYVFLIVIAFMLAHYTF